MYGRTAAASGFSCLLGRGSVWLERNPGVQTWPLTACTFPGKVPVLYEALEKAGVPDEANGLDLLGTGGGATVLEGPLAED